MVTYDLEKFFDFAPALFCILGTGGEYVRLNYSYTSILGWSAAEIFKTPYMKYVHPDDVEKCSHEIDRLSHGAATTVTFGNRYRCKDHSYRTLRWSLFRKDGVLFGIGHDVTELSETYRLFKLLIENSPTGMVLVDNQGVIQIANREAGHIFGYQQGELIDQSIEILLPDQTRVKHIQIRKRYNHNPQSRPMGTGRDL